MVSQVVGIDYDAGDPLTLKISELPGEKWLPGYFDQDLWNVWLDRTQSRSTAGGQEHHIHRGYPDVCRAQ